MQSKFFFIETPKMPFRIYSILHFLFFIFLRTVPILGGSQHSPNPREDHEEEVRLVPHDLRLRSMCCPTSVLCNAASPTGSVKEENSEEKDS